MGIAAPHVSPQGGWQSYRAAYKELTPDFSGPHLRRARNLPLWATLDKFGLTRKPFETAFGRTRIDQTLVAELEAQPAALPEDYCHAVEHSIEFQVIFLQTIYGADVRILPLLCGSFGRSMMRGDFRKMTSMSSAFLGRWGRLLRERKNVCSGCWVSIWPIWVCDSGINVRPMQTGMR